MKKSAKLCEIGEKAQKISASGGGLRRRLRRAASRKSPFTDLLTTPDRKSSPVRCRTVAALARRVLRVSASARRVAAAYGDASLLLAEARTHDSLLFSGDAAAELAVDMARFCVRHNGTFASPCITQVLHDPEK